MRRSRLPPGQYDAFSLSIAFDAGDDLRIFFPSGYISMRERAGITASGLRAGFLPIACCPASTFNAL